FEFRLGSQLRAPREAGCPRRAWCAAGAAEPRMRIAQVRSLAKEAVMRFARGRGRRACESASKRRRRRRAQREAGCARRAWCARDRGGATDADRGSQLPRAGGGDAMGAGIARAASVRVRVEAKAAASRAARSGLPEEGLVRRSRGEAADADRASPVPREGGGDAMRAGIARAASVRVRVEAKAAASRAARSGLPE